jgi:hypothetical protein
MEAMSLDGWMKGKKDKKRVQKERRRQILFNANIPSYDASWLILFYGE